MDYQGSANNPCSSDAFSKSVHESNQNDVKNGLGIESSCFSMRLWEATVTDRYTVVRCNCVALVLLCQHTAETLLL